MACFLPALVPVWSAYSNLRSHRKILVIDGCIGFTGGMNIRESAASKRSAAIEDLHFRLDGPVVAHLQHVFADDWLFTTKESLAGDAWFPPLGAKGPVLARGVSDGPDEDFDELRFAYLGALACAESSVQIITPYFLPDSALITSLNVAAMRGVAVDILLPQENNLRFVQWASTAQLWQLLEYDCRIWLTPPPFEHTKLMVVDKAWTSLGLRQLGPAQPALELRVQRRVLRCGPGRPDGPPGRRKTGPLAPIDAGRRRRPKPADQAPRRRCPTALAIPVKATTKQRKPQMDADKHRSEDAERTAQHCLSIRRLSLHHR